MAVFIGSTSSQAAPADPSQRNPAPPPNRLPAIPALACTPQLGYCHDMTQVPLLAFGTAGLIVWTIVRQYPGRTWRIIAFVAGSLAGGAVAWQYGSDVLPAEGSEAVASQADTIRAVVVGFLAAVVGAGLGLWAAIRTEEGSK